MSDFKFTGHIQGRELVVEVDKLLRAAGIPSILWDTCLLDIYGVPMVVSVRSGNNLFVWENTLRDD